MPRTKRSLLIIVMLAASLWSIGPAMVDAQGQAQTQTGTAANLDARQEAAADAAREISRLEASGDFLALYDRLHPDSRAIVPREVVIGWYEADLASRRTAELTVTDVQFVNWTWGVTGESYPRTAEVSFIQPYWMLGVREDITAVVHLVADDGEWKWFFGGSLVFVQQQIDLYAAASSAVVPASGSARTPAQRAALFPDPLHAHVDAFWEGRFADAGFAYQSPGGVVGLTRPTMTACGRADPVTEAAFYCVLDATIYYSTDFRQIVESQIGDFGWIVVVAHEWGHHVQVLLGIDLAAAPSLAGEFIPLELEQQADCLAGAYTRDAQRVGWLDPGDIQEALIMTELAGDPAGTPWDDPYAHGSGEERIAAFESGFTSGIAACEIAI